jgi:hypothetical protein
LIIKPFPIISPNHSFFHCSENYKIVIVILFQCTCKHHAGHKHDKMSQECYFRKGLHILLPKI